MNKNLGFYHNLDKISMERIYGISLPFFAAKYQNKDRGSFILLGQT